MSTTSSNSTQIMNEPDAVEVKVFEHGIAKAVADLNKAWEDKYNKKVRQLQKETAKQGEIKKAIEELNGAWKSKYTEKVEKICKQTKQTAEEEKKEIQKLIQELNMAWEQKYKTLKQTVEELGHENRTIDIFKIDCEGCELDSFHTWSEAGVNLRQILVEVHDSGRDHRIHLPKTHYFFRHLYSQGYVIFHKEPNIHWWHVGGSVEFALLKLNMTFFNDMPAWEKANEQYKLPAS